MYLVAQCFGDQSACRRAKALEVCMCMCSIVFYSLIIIINIYIEERIIEFYLFLYDVVVMHSCATHTARQPVLVLPAHQNDNQSHQNDNQSHQKVSPTYHPPQSKVHCTSASGHFASPHPSNVLGQRKSPEGLRS
jgi:hypothetical protein